MTQTSWTLRGSNGQTIFGNTHLPQADQASRSVVILCHGFKGYKDYGFFPYLADQLANAGHIAHRFNFSHSGMTNQIERFEQTELFANDTWSKQMFDLKVVAQAVCDSTLVGQGLPTTWFGHSRGGTTTLLTAGEVFLDPAYQNIRPAMVIAASAPDDANSLNNEQQEMIREQGYLHSPSARTGQRLKVNRIWLDEILAQPARHSPCAAIEKINCPVNLIHGEDDRAISPQTSKKLYQTRLQTSTQPTELVMIPNASHVFNSPNPLSEKTVVPDETKMLAAQLLAWQAKAAGLSSS